MEELNYKIVRARKKDAEFLARSVTGALGEELCVDLAGGKDNLPKVYEMFFQLAESENSQYSFRNAFVAEQSDGKLIGAIIFYDGARLHELRRAFIHSANEILGWRISEKDMEEWGDETGPDQVYIDSLFVEPEFRKHGIATRLFEEVFEAEKSLGKPFGLLVEPENKSALKLYEKVGFRQNGISNFFHAPMLKMQRPNLE